jgi:hypothetical protein
MLNIFYDSICETESCDSNAWTWLAPNHEGTNGPCALFETFNNV